MSDAPAQGTVHPPTWEAHLPPGTDPATVALTPAANLTARWVAHWRARPGDVFLLDDHGDSLSGAELDAASATAAGRLAGRGLRAGDRVLISCGSSLELAIAHIGALRLGLVVIPANTAYRAEELAHIIGDAEPRLAIIDDPERAGWVRQAAPIEVLAPELAVADADGGGLPALDATTLESPALIGYTSGTTGRPKGAVLSHGNLLASVEAVRIAWRWTPSDRLWLCLPLFHMHGLGVGLHGTLAVGASAVISARFDLDALLDAARQRRATMFFGVPTMSSRLAAAADAGALANLRLLVSGSAPLPADLHRALEQASGARVLERYGMTETAMLVSNPFDGDRRPGTVGIPLPGVELRLDAATSEVLVKGPNVFGGYLGRPDANAEAFTADGFFHTGDVGEYDEAGYLKLVARMKELIISGGYNVYPREVEDALRLHPAVHDAAVVGEADPEWGEAVTAYCETDGSVSGEELIAFVGEHLARYKRPKRVSIVSALPRNAMGKVVKASLADAPTTG
ncbi:MAG: AMP-binding protein [Acidimicrobiales bacterium]